MMILGNVNPAAGTIAALALLLAGCAPATDPGPAPSAQPIATPAPAGRVVAAPVLAIEGEGLRLFAPDSGSARPIAFGTARAATLGALAFRGMPDLGTQTECGAGELDFASWPDGLKLYFQRDRFVGWALSGRGERTVTTAAGIGISRSRQDLIAAYAATFKRTTLGTEFAAGGLYGLLDGPGEMARISDMWAGTSCNFR